MRAIITGATGVIGRALVGELVENNIEVLVLVRPDSERKNAIINNALVTVLECGMEDYCILKNGTGKEYDIFFHLSWAGTFGNSRNDMYLQNMNVRYALDAVKLAKEFGCKRFVGLGSQAEYGRVEGKLTPDTPTFPENGYGIAKLCAGQMTRELARQNDMEHIWIRVLSVYGPGDGDNTMVMSTINKLRTGVEPEFTKAEQLWDYLYSKDAAKAIRLLGKSGKDGEIYVLGSGQVAKLSDYIDIIHKTVNINCGIILGAIPYVDRQVMHLQADISAITEDTGWTPETDFETGIRAILNDLQRD